MFKKTETLTNKIAERWAVWVALLIAIFMIKNANAVCTADSRTNVSANSVLTSTKYNSDLNTLYNRLNGNLDGECIEDGSITKDELAAGSFSADYQSKTSIYTLTSTDDVVSFDATSGAITATLPTAVGISDKIYVIHKSDSSSNTVGIDANGSETINGDLTRQLKNQNEFIWLLSDNANWKVIGSNAGPEVETKILSSDVTTNGSISELESSALEAGAWYRISGSFTTNDSSEDSFAIDIAENGNTLQRLDHNPPNSGVVVYNRAISTIFQATATGTVTFTTLGFAGGTSASVAGNGTRTETFVQIEKLPFPGSEI